MQDDPSKSGPTAGRFELCVRGELDLTLAAFDGAFADGVLLEVAFEPRSRRAPWKLVRFAQAPAASFGDTGSFMLGLVSIRQGTYTR